MATLEQQRAKFALAHVEEIRHGGKRAKFKTQLLKLPARLHTNGLGQTTAFYLAAGPAEPEKKICDWLGAWMHQREIYRTPDLCAEITGRGSSDDAEVERRYRRASAEARALAVWLKRFAEAFIEEPQEGGTG